MVSKSKKVKTGATTSEAASVSEGMSGGAPPSAPIVASDEDTVPTLADATSVAIGPNDVPASLSSPHTASDTIQAIAQSASDARSLNVSNLALHFDAVDAALSDGLVGRESLNIKNDDFEHEKSDGHPKEWVKKLVQALGHDYLGEPEDTKKNRPEQKEWYARWQKQAHVGVVAIYEMKDPSHLEKCCWYLFDAIIKAHKLGVFTTAANNWAPSKLKRSKRLAVLVSIVKKYATVRLDILRLWHIEEIAANPEAFIKRKLCNCWNNGIRAQKYGKTREAGEAAEQKVDGKKETQTDAEINEDRDSRADSPPRSTGEGQTTADGTGASKSKVGGKGKGKAKRARSPTPETLGPPADKRPTIRRRPAGKKTPVALATKGRSDDKAPSAGPEAERTT